MQLCLCWCAMQPGMQPASCFLYWWGRNAFHDSLKSCGVFSKSSTLGFLIVFRFPSFLDSSTMLKGFIKCLPCLGYKKGNCLSKGDKKCRDCFLHQKVTFILFPSVSGLVSEEKMGSSWRRKIYTSKAESFSICWSYTWHHIAHLVLVRNETGVADTQVLNLGSQCILQGFNLFMKGAERSQLHPNSI